MANQQNNGLSNSRSVSDIAVGFIITVEEAGGTIEDARRAIFKDEPLRKQIGLLVMGKLKLAMQPSQIHVPHLIPDWVTGFIKDVEPTIEEGANLSFPSFLRDGDNGRTDGSTMRKRAVEMVADKGLSDVPALLGKDGKGLSTIPVELRDSKVSIVLTGTVLRDSRGYLCVPYLYWLLVEWCLDFRRLGSHWGGNDRLVSSE